MRVLVLCPHYLPGFRAGGPVRSVSTMVERVGEQVEFHIITHARDFRQKELYPEVLPGQWTTVGNARVLYLRDRSLSPLVLRKHICAAKPDAVYLNSFFNPQMTIGPLLLRRLGMLPKVPFVIAPRGEFSSAALAIHPTKKRLFMSFARLIGLYKNLLWQASSEFEKQDIRRGLKRNVRTVVMHVAPDISPVYRALDAAEEREPKEAGRLKIVFVGRISRMKNLDYAIARLANLGGNVTFDIYGPMEDRSHVERCKGAVRKLPDNVVVEFHGEIPHHEAVLQYARHDLFFMPTLGENFGHVILESLISGCPVLISDRTPWRNLEEKGVGWDFPLDDPGSFESALQRVTDMDATQWQVLSEASIAHAATVADDSQVPEATVRMFVRAHEILSKPPEAQSEGSPPSG